MIQSFRTKGKPSEALVKRDSIGVYLADTVALTCLCLSPRYDIFFGAPCNQLKYNCKIWRETYSNRNSIADTSTKHYLYIYPLQLSWIQHQGWPTYTKEASYIAISKPLYGVLVDFGQLRVLLSSFSGVMGYGAAEATGLGFVWSDGMRCCRSDWPGLFLFCCCQPSCVVSQQSWFGLFFCFINFPILPPIFFIEILFYAPSSQNLLLSSSLTSIPTVKLSDFGICSTTNEKVRGKTSYDWQNSKIF